MSNRLSEVCHFVNGLPPVADAFNVTGESDIVDLNKYAAVTFVIVTGVTTTANGIVTVLAGTSVATAATAIAFKYRTILAPATTNVPTALTDATTAGFSMTASKANAIYIIEVDGRELAAGGFTTCKVLVTEVTNDPQTASIIAILSGPRYDATQDATL
jgi:hypothetical protein